MTAKTAPVANSSRRLMAMPAAARVRSLPVCSAAAAGVSLIRRGVEGGEKQVVSGTGQIITGVRSHGPDYSVCLLHRVISPALDDRVRPVCYPPW